MCIILYQGNSINFAALFHTKVTGWREKAYAQEWLLVCFIRDSFENRSFKPCSNNREGDVYR